MDDLISRQAAIDEILEWKTRMTTQGLADRIAMLPSAQPEPAIPISWLEKEVEHLESRKNSFAVLDAMQLKAHIKRWRGEQNENT